MFKSPYEKLDGIVWFPRMLEKIRTHSKGRLSEEYVAYLGSGFDSRCVLFLGVEYEALKEQVLKGKSDAEVMAWCKEVGHSRSDADKLVWNEFMKKRGWRDSDAPSDALKNYKETYGLGDRDDIKTFFDFFEIDEGREAESHQAVQAISTLRSASGTDASL